MSERKDGGREGEREEGRERVDEEEEEEAGEIRTSLPLTCCRA